VRHRLAAVLRFTTPSLALAGLLTVVVVAFAWPTSQQAPREIPIAVTGSDDFVAQATQQLDRAGADGFEIRVAPNPQAAQELLRDNVVDGAFEQSDLGSTLVLAAAGRPAVANVLTEVHSRLSHERQSVTNGVPFPVDDPDSAVFAISGLPTILGAVGVGIILTVLRGSKVRRLLRIAIIAAVSGIALTLVENSWLGAIGGHWWSAAGCYAVGVGAVLAAVNGLHNVFGRLGSLAAAVVIMLVGNPLSGATSAPELLPEGWATLGQILPPGALTSALRAVGFYGDHGASSPILVLGAWLIVGILLLLAGPAGIGQKGMRASLAPLSHKGAPAAATEEDSHRDVAALV
jgi:hypothetical protein